MVPDMVPLSPGESADVAFCIQVNNSFCFSDVTCFSPETEQDRGCLKPDVWKKSPWTTFLQPRSASWLPGAPAVPRQRILRILSGTEHAGVANVSLQKLGLQTLSFLPSAHLINRRSHYLNNLENRVYSPKTAVLDCLHVLCLWAFFIIFFLLIYF